MFLLCSRARAETMPEWASSFGLTRCFASQFPTPWSEMDVALAASLPQHLVFSTESAALQSYEQHLKKEGDVEVKLFQFSENDELDVVKLNQELDEGAETSHVWVLLLSTGESSYLCLDPKHNPWNVKL
eukprot:Skav218603  [mRNA]  locus=scaffold2815:91575:92755:- [translate_table: standard]